MNGRMGGPQDIINWVISPTVRPFHKTSDIVRPSPTEANVFIDEQAGATPQETSIDDGFFAVRAMPNVWLWQNAPASRHGNGGVLSFADGHAELWRWYEPNTQRLKGLDNAASPGNRDLQRLKEATYRP